MNLRTIDLNLLVILDALLDEAHVSRAADRLGLSQPATSAALERCRHLFGDPLLERGKAGMRATPKAETLRAPIKSLLVDIQGLVNPPEVDLTRLRQTVRIVMADHPATIVVPPLYAHLARTAPGIDLVILPWHGGAAALDALTKGSADLAVSVFPQVDAAIDRTELLYEHYVIAMRHDHPAAVDFSLTRWLDYPHVLVSGRGETQTPLDRTLASQGLARRVGVVLPSFLMVPALLAVSDMIAMLPSRCLPAEVRPSFAFFPPPLPVEGFPLHLAYHKRCRTDRATQHVADALKGLLR